MAYDSNNLAQVSNRDLQKISEWAHKWKMTFNPDLQKEAQGYVLKDIDQHT